VKCGVLELHWVWGSQKDIPYEDWEQRGRDDMTFNDGDGDEKLLIIVWIVVIELNWSVYGVYDRRSQKSKRKKKK